jgi:hypothetical protein
MEVLMFRLKYTCLNGAVALSLAGFVFSTEQAIKDHMKGDLDVIKNTFDVYYAPKEWKKSHFGWDLGAEIQKAKDKVQASDSINVKQFRYIVRDFFQSTKDYHVGVYFHSTESSTLPFSLKALDGKYYISYIDESKLDCMVYPLSIGDEVVEFNSRPIAEVIQELKETLTRNSNTATDEEMASFYLTHRSGRAGHVVPRGNAVISTQSLWDNNLTQIQLRWEYQPEKISNGFEGSLVSFSSANNTNLLDRSNVFDKLMVMPDYPILKSFTHKANEDDGQDEKRDNFIGSKISQLPILGKIWWQTSLYCPFDAYIYETEDHHLVGFIRIPDYMGGNDEAEEFGSIISLFEERTEGLVVDQMNNPGGFLLYTYGLLSMLTDEPLSVPKEREMITQQEVVIALEVIKLLEEIKSNEDAQLILGNEIAGIPITYQTTLRLLDYFKFIQAQWESGNKFTEPYYLLGFDQILPHPTVRYTKPILVLVNSLDFSCGDYFPAILQDNKRAKLIGRRTAGAGGYILPGFFPNRHGISMFTLTGPIAERLDNNPIENLGISPDIEYQFTFEDVVFGYPDFANTVNNQIINLL